VKKTDALGIEDLLLLASDELEKSINAPDIRNFEPYDSQGDYLRCNSFGTILSAGNRAGKTDVMIVKAILLAWNDDRFCQRPARWGNGPIQVRIVTVDQVKGVYQIMIPKFKRWLSKDMLIDGDWDKSWDDRLQTLTLSNGSSIDFLTYGMTVEKFAGLPRHIILFDEEPPREIFNECMYRLKDYGGIWSIAATPDDGYEWIQDLLIDKWESREVPREILEVFYLDVSKNPYLKGEKDGRYNLAMDEDEIEIREKGVYKPKGGLIFPDFDKNFDKLVVPVREPFLTRGSEFYMSIDFGWRHPTAVLWHEVAPNGDIHTFAEHYKSFLTPAEHARIIKEYEFAWAKDYPRIFNRENVTRIGDPHGVQKTANTGTSVISEYGLLGIDIGVEGIPLEVMIGIQKMHQYFRLRKDGTPRWTISENCPNLIKELRKLRWETYESAKLNYSRAPKQEVHKKADDAFDSARYFATLQPDPTPDRTDQKVLSWEDYMEDLQKRNGEDAPIVEFYDTNLHNGADTYGYEVEYEMEDFL
jgi:phage terminase large subunit-like protein